MVNEKFVSAMFELVNFIEDNHPSILPQDSTSSPNSDKTDVEIWDLDSGPESLNNNPLSSKIINTTTIQLPGMFQGSTELNLSNLKFKVPKNLGRMAFHEKWMSNFQQLQKFKKNYGHCNISRTTPGYYQLGAWLAEQRRKLKLGKLTEQQFKLLNEIGVQWKKVNH